MEAFTSFKKGDRVIWRSDDGDEHGTVRWIGVLPDEIKNDNITIGVEFDNPVGTGTGKYKDQRLFYTQQGHASLIPPLGLVKEEFHHDPILSDQDEIQAQPQNSKANKMEELKDEIAALKDTVKSLESQVSAMSLTKQQEELQILQQPKFSPTMPTKYSDLKYLSSKERKEIKFGMGSNSMKNVTYDDGKPTQFYDFTRDGEDEVDNPKKFDGLTDISRGRFVTPVPGRYRLHVWGKMEGDYNGKAEWYICMAPKYADMYDEKKSDPDNDDNADSEDSDDSEEKERKKKEIEEEKERNLSETATRQLMFTIDAKGYKVTERCEGYVGIECDRDVVFWTEVVVTEGQFAERHYSPVCLFSGRLIC